MSLYLIIDLSFVCAKSVFEKFSKSQLIETGADVKTGVFEKILSCGVSSHNKCKAGAQKKQLPS